MKTKTTEITGMAIAILAANLFSAKVLFVKVAYADGATPLQILAIRMGTALPVFGAVLAYMLWKYPEKRPSMDECAWMTVIGLIGYYLSSLLDFHGIIYLSSGMERLLLYLYPSFIVLIRSVLQRSIPRAHEMLALVFAYGGTTLVYWEERQLAGPDVVRGSLLVVGAAFCFAVYLYCSSFYIKKFGSGLFAAYSTAVSCLAIILHGAVSGSTGGGPVTPLILLIGIFMGIFCTVIPTFALHQAIRLIGSAKVGILGTTGLICPLLLGYTLFGEPLTPLRLAGAALVLLSVVFLNGKRELKGDAISRPNLFYKFDFFFRTKG